MPRTGRQRRLRAVVFVQPGAIAVDEDRGVVWIRTFSGRPRSETRTVRITEVRPADRTAELFEPNP